MRAVSWVRLIGVAATLAPNTWASASPACPARNLGTLGGGSAYANDINDWGQIVGRSALPGDGVQHAFLWEGGRMRDLGGLGEGSWSEASAINEWGTIVGAAELPSEDFVPVIWTRRTLARLPFEGELGVATDINNRGQIVGYRNFSECLLWDTARSQPTRLGGLGGRYCKAIAINDEGTIVGAATTADEDMRAFVWRDGVMTEAESIDDPPFEYSFSELLDINNREIAVGRIVSSGLLTRPILWSPERGGRILERVDTIATAVNDWGTLALVQHLEGSSLLLSQAEGDAVAFGELGGGVLYDGLALNNRFQMAWTADAAAYVCQLRWWQLFTGSP